MQPPLILRVGTQIDDAQLASAAVQATEAADDVFASIAVARALGVAAPLPGAGRTGELWSLLATLAAADLTVARVVEPHLDALAILAQAGVAAEPDAVWGVYAAERAGTALAASSRDGGVVLDGVKPWCSLAGSVDRALISARLGAGSDRARQLFSVDLRHPGVSADAGTWHARGLASVVSGDVRFDAVPALAVGDPGWYLERPGFAWGGIGVAACWYGGAAALAQALIPAAREREPDQIGLAALGRADRLLLTARLALEAAAIAVDDGHAIGHAGSLLASRVRGVVAEVAEQIIGIVGRSLGPAPLTLDEAHARRVADLTVYIRQHHAERDDARLGAAMLESGAPSW